MEEKIEQIKTLTADFRLLVTNLEKDKQGLKIQKKLIRYQKLAKKYQKLNQQNETLKKYIY